MKHYIIISTGDRSFPEEITITLKSEVQKTAKLQSCEPVTLTDMDVAGAVIFTGLSRQKIYSLIAKNQIPYGRNGHRIFFVKDHLTNWLKRNPVDSGHKEKKNETRPVKRFEIKLTDM